MASRESSPHSQLVDAEAVSELEAVPLHSRDLLTLLDTQGIIQYESPAIERLYGYDQNELVGEQVADYFHPEDRQRVVEAFEAVVTGEANHTESVEYRHLMADGSYKWIESVGSANPTPEGNYVINSRDISERKQREVDLQQARAQLQTEHDAKEAIHRLLFERSTGATLAESVCRLLIEEYGYNGAWVVRQPADEDESSSPYHIVASEGDEAFRRSGSTNDSQSAVDAVTQAVCETGEAVTVEADSAGDRALANDQALSKHLGDCGLRAVRAVPIEHDGLVDGVLTVVRETEEPPLAGSCIEEFAAALAFKHQLRRQREALRADTLTELSVRFGASHFLAAVSTAPSLPEETHIRASEIHSTDASVVSLLKTTDVEAELLARAASEVDAIQECKPITNSEPAVVQIRIAEPTLGSVVSAHGGSVESVSAVDGVVDLVARVSELTDITAVTESIQTEWPDAVVRANTEVTVDSDDASGFEGLTIKQQQALRAATVAGFFQRPQEATASDIAEMLGVARTTFLHHLRGAERAVFSEGVDDSASLDR